MNYQSLSGYKIGYIHNELNFHSPIDPTNEELMYEFLIKNIQSNLQNLKTKDQYQQRIVELESNMSSIDQFHMLNVSRMLKDE